MAQTIGIVDIVWRGRRLPVEKGARILLGGLKNNPVVFGRGVAFSRENIASQVTCVTFLAKGARYDDIVTMDEGELQAICDTGAIFTFPAAFLTERPEIDDMGKMTLTWQAGEYEEVISG
jgi:hypothetical protein